MIDQTLANPVFWIYIAVLIPYLLFGIRYATHSPWRESIPGKAIMYLVSTLNLVLARALVNLAWGTDWPGYLLVTFIMLGAAFTSGCYLLYALLREQDRGRRLLDSDRQQGLLPEHFDRRRARGQRKLLKQLQRTELYEAEHQDDRKNRKS